MRGWQRPVLITICVLLGACLATLVVLIPWANLRLTKYVESDEFRAELEKQTAKGLHFPAGHYAPIKRTGTWTAETDSFQAQEGQKALRGIDARGVTAKFNPWGVFSRVWLLQDIRIDRGQVEIQVYEPRPEPSPPKPWYAKYILPERVYLKHVESQPADVTWRFRGKRAGIFSTRLVITPYDRDFEYDASGGQLRMNPFPELQVKKIHTLITKRLLTLNQLDLIEKSAAGAALHVEGKAGTQPNDRSVDFRFTLQDIALPNWLPADWRAHVDGLASLKIHWTGKDPKLESSAGEGDCRIDRGEIHDLPFLQNLAAIAKDKSLESIKLDTCQFEVQWQFPKVEVRRLTIEQKGKFRAEGEIIARKESLGGTIDLGVAPALLEFLTEPVMREVFPREKEGYRWATVHLSGTLEEPRLDLSTRVIEAMKAHPAAALKILFRQLAESFHGAAGGD